MPADFDEPGAGRTPLGTTATDLLMNGDGRAADPLREPGHERGPGQVAEQDVIDVLVEQHAWIQHLFEQVLSASGKEKRELFGDLVRLLAAHETGEEQVVHPVSRKLIPDGAAMVEARLQEEKAAKKLLKDLVDDEIGGPRFDERLAELRVMVLAHARQEERQEFGRLRHLAPAKQLAGMVGALRAAQAIAPTRPHPSVQSAAGNALAGPPMAIIDRIRDFLGRGGSSK